MRRLAAIDIAPARPDRGQRQRVGGGAGRDRKDAHRRLEQFAEAVLQPRRPLVAAIAERRAGIGAQHRVEDFRRRPPGIVAAIVDHVSVSHSPEPSLIRLARPCREGREAGRPRLAAPAVAASLGCMQRYSFLSLARHALTGHRGWTPAWRKAAPRARYDVVIIGGGGHGLATAYYLAKEHGVRDVAVLEKGPIGLGNTGRNTTIIRSNYLWDASARIYEHSLKLWEGLSAELNFNVMLSQRGVLNLAHNEADIREGRGGSTPTGSTASTPSGSTPTPSNASVRSSISRATRAIRCSARRCSGAAAWRGTTRSPGAMRGPPMRAASISSRIARSPRSAPRAGGSPASKPAAARSPPARSRSRPPATIRSSLQWPGCACHCRAIRCRRWSRSRSSRCSTAS